MFSGFNDSCLMLQNPQSRVECMSSILKCHNLTLKDTTVSSGRVSENSYSMLQILVMVWEEADFRVLNYQPSVIVSVTEPV